MPLDYGFVFYPEAGGRAGSGALVRPLDVIPATSHSIGEAVAALKVVTDTPRDAPLKIILSTQALAKDMTERLQRWEDRGWIGIAGSQVLRALVNKLRQRCAPTIFGKASNSAEYTIRNNACDLAKEQFLAQTTTTIRLSIDKAFDLTGAKLSTLTQAIAYRGIRDRLRLQDRPRTAGQVQRTTDNSKGPGLRAATTAELWTSIRHKDFHRKIVDFLWKGMHEAHKIGPFWAHISGYEERADCPTCGCRETLRHILTECTATGQALIWKLTQNAWRRRSKTWRTPSLEDALAAGLGRYPRGVGEKPREPLARLWRILVSEAAYLIWKLRCERVIGHEDDPEWQHSPTATIQRWYASLNRRLQLDLVATRRSFGRLTVSRRLVWSTWTAIVGDELGLPEDWTLVPRVLVGIDPEVCRIEEDPG
ncbi:uncharacterized protein C8Q71DRAFT_829641 [Rhodofomes roseus]|uniref:Reverse transcriptase zinc-binding domain-containing protein n=1 Tax=Rhodofomes roseus TaxID=34475 RepID=A0ABQ8KS46_9APHY|nr:uncharacterized protein C8Q71DRAFT_829641 [Rhodofomes roseus]KAH9840759.1 hypothetical protein C8Q71DRAFT_829641 [Rhodofomes roseus]